MNRRNFIGHSSFALVAAAGLPKAIRKFQEEAPAKYQTALDKTKTTGQAFYQIEIFDSALDDLKTASETQKIITLKVAWFLADFTKPQRQGEYQYTITNVTARKDTASEKLVKTKFSKKVTGDQELDANFPKDPNFLIRVGESAKILSKKKEVLYDLKFNDGAQSTGGTGCFLTTACVQHQQLADDCEELQTLRFLRDHYMVKNNEGVELIKHYCVVGPSLVKAIDDSVNAGEIYDYMYKNMIIPSVKLVNAGKYEEATQHYKLFVNTLIKRYQ